MKAQQRYLEDPDRLLFESQVSQQWQLADGRTAVTLAQSYFYPSGGGQEHDHGTLNNQPVLDVYLAEDGVVVHVLAEPLAAGPVQAQIDPVRRWAHRQQHTGQHLLSACFVQLFGYETVSAGVSDTRPATIDLPLDAVLPEQLAQAEELANRVIQENRPVKTYFVAPDQVSEIPLRKAPKVSANIRVVEIAGFDYSPCGGTHVHQTGAIGMLKILRTERVNQKLRIHFVTGQLALAAFQAFQNSVQELALRWSVHPDDLLVTQERQLEQLKSAQHQLEQLSAAQLRLEAQVLQAQARPLGKNQVITKDCSPRPPGELRQLGQYLIQASPLDARLVCVLASAEAGKLSLLVACQPGSGVVAR
ncbi:MAG: alanyl-tRNA editing protein, partial [Anaerolineales bacterium]|nr:alanyl-tRNA editing protein [Anaerolineales bacterium]